MRGPQCAWPECSSSTTRGTSSSAGQPSGVSSGNGGSCESACVTRAGGASFAPRDTAERGGSSRGTVAHDARLTVDASANQRPFVRHIKVNISASFDRKTQTSKPHYTSARGVIAAADTRLFAQEDLFMSKRAKIVAIGALSLIAVGGGLFSAIVLGGAVDVGATDRHSRIVHWMLHTTMRNAVRASARAVEIPAGVDLRDRALAEKAFGHYSVACTTCHGAPGVAPSPWMVTNPQAPLLVETADRWSDRELYWVIKNGIKMTGMPALGPTHKESDLWAIAAFVRQLPTMGPDEYQAMSGRHAPMTSAAAPGEIEIVVEGGYKPARVEVGAGKPIRLKFIRREYGGCTREVVFPALNIRRELPPNRAVTVELPANLAPGEYEFKCGMDMIRGTLVVT
jgi:mono/diheme cytochrome c family protein